MSDIPVTAVLVLVLLLLCAGLFAILFKRLRFPTTIGLVLVGLGLGAIATRVDGLAFIARLHFTPNIVLYILLPALVFDAALTMDTRLLIKNLMPVLLLAAPGLVFGTLVTGALMGALTPLSFGAAMLFGALISTTDPVAVIAVFKELGAPRRLTMLVDGESLFNDATSIVLFNILLALLAGGGTLGAGTVAGAAVEFAVVFLGGALVGALVGFVMVHVLALTRNDPLVEIAFTAVIAYLAFILAQFYLQWSGVMAVVGAGLVVSYYASTRFTPDVRQQLRHFWEFACYAANSYIFLLLGLTEGYLSRIAERLPRVGLVVLAALFIVTLTRALLVFGFSPLINRLSRQRPITRPEQAVLFWGGLRGALPIALAMSLTPEQVGGEANRILILDCTLGTVLFTLLVQGTTISRLMNFLKLNALAPVEQILLRNLRLVATNDGREAVDALARAWPQLDPRPVAAVRREYDQTLASLHAALPIADPSGTRPEAIASGVLWAMALHEANTVWRELFEQGFLPEDVLRETEHYLITCREEVLHGILPPAAVRQPGFEQRAIGLLLALVERAFPRAPWTRRLRRLSTRRRYALHLAGASAGRRVLDNLPRLQTLAGAAPDAARICAAWFRAWHNASVDALAGLLADPGSDALDLQESTLRRYARLTEQRTLEELVRRGALPEALVPHLPPPEGSGLA